MNRGLERRTQDRWIVGGGWGGGLAMEHLSAGNDTLRHSVPEPGTLDRKALNSSLG